MQRRKISAPTAGSEGLEALVGALNAEGNLNELGEAVYADQIVGLLSSRLEIEKWYAEYPEIEQQEIVAPLFGIGLPRTGSTALSFLLACDQSRRSLRTWEASSPCPPPETATEHTDPRIAVSRAGIEMSHQMFPDFVGMLPSSPTGPSECLLLMGLDFHSQLFQGMAILPSYTEWLLTCEMEPTYRYHKRVLKLLQWSCPPVRWSLKTPSHMATIRGPRCRLSRRPLRDDPPRHHERHPLRVRRQRRRSLRHSLIRSIAWRSVATST